MDDQIMMANRFRWLTRRAFLLIILVSLFSSSSSCSPGGDSGKTESITFANLRLPASTLIYVAADKQYFSGNGLAVTIKENDTGMATTDALLKGEADLATMAEFLMVGNTLRKQRLSILGTMDKTMTIVLIGIKNRGITKVSDLAGKRIGLGRASASEFYLGRFLELHGMSIKDVVVVDTPPPGLKDAVSSGDVDAVVAWAPYTRQIQECFENETVVWQVQSGQSVFGLIVGGNDWIASHPKTVIRFWRSLAQAEDFLVRHPDEAKDILRKKLGYDKAYIDSIWPQYDFSLSLDQSLITAMEDETRWMISNHLTTEKQVPNFNEHINGDALKAVRPEVVSIIR
jgi:ABC-type nitrate/sulfonate/bicarbonate transport system substrate-binding protein